MVKKYLLFGVGVFAAVVIVNMIIGLSFVPAAVQKLWYNGTTS